MSSRAPSSPHKGGGHMHKHKHRARYWHGHRHKHQHTHKHRHGHRHGHGRLPSPGMLGCLRHNMHRDGVLSLMLHSCVVYCMVMVCQSSGRDLFLIHRHRDEVLSFMLHCSVVYCIVVGCRSSGRDSFFFIIHIVVHRCCR